MRCNGCGHETYCTKCQKCSNCSPDFGGSFCDDCSYLSRPLSSNELLALALTAPNTQSADMPVDVLGELRFSNSNSNDTASTSATGVSFNATVGSNRVLVSTARNHQDTTSCYSTASVWPHSPTIRSGSTGNTSPGVSANGPNALNSSSSNSSASPSTCFNPRTRDINKCARCGSDGALFYSFACHQHLFCRLCTNVTASQADCPLCACDTTVGATSNGLPKPHLSASTNAGAGLSFPSSSPSQLMGSLSIAEAPSLSASFGGIASGFRSSNLSHDPQQSQASSELCAEDAASPLQSVGAVGGTDFGINAFGDLYPTNGPQSFMPLMSNQWPSLSGITPNQLASALEQCTTSNEALSLHHPTHHHSQASLPPLPLSQQQQQQARGASGPSSESPNSMNDETLSPWPSISGAALTDCSPTQGWGQGNSNLQSPSAMNSNPTQCPMCGNHWTTVDRAGGISSYCQGCEMFLCHACFTQHSCMGGMGSCPVDFRNMVGSLTSIDGTSSRLAITNNHLDIQPSELQHQQAHPRISSANNRINNNHTAQHNHHPQSRQHHPPPRPSHPRQQHPRQQANQGQARHNHFANNNAGGGRFRPRHPNPQLLDGGPNGGGRGGANSLLFFGGGGGGGAAPGVGRGRGGGGSHNTNSNNAAVTPAGICPNHPFARVVRPCEGCSAVACDACLQADHQLCSAAAAAVVTAANHNSNGASNGTARRQPPGRPREAAGPAVSGSNGGAAAGAAAAGATAGAAGATAASAGASSTPGSEMRVQSRLARIRSACSEISRRHEERAERVRLFFDRMRRQISSREEALLQMLDMALTLRQKNLGVQERMEENAARENAQLDPDNFLVWEDAEIEFVEPSLQPASDPVAQVLAQTHIYTSAFVPHCHVTCPKDAIVYTGKLFGFSIYLKDHMHNPINLRGSTAGPGITDLRVTASVLGSNGQPTQETMGATVQHYTGSTGHYGASLYPPNRACELLVHCTLRGQDFPNTPMRWRVEESRDYRKLANALPVQILGNSAAPGCAPGQFNRPWGIACDAEGFLVVSDRANGRIQVRGRWRDYWHYELVQTAEGLLFYLFWW